MSEAVDHQVEIQCYGILQQVCGGSDRRVQVAALPATVAEILESLVRDVPDVRGYLNHTACAIGDRIVEHDTRLQPGETLVLLPPVSGG